ncbi:hypothetical protein BPSP16_10120 [Brachyspira pilosicoli SP16]|nr:hypothetical protein BPSP16_10120 [Brachyspira pilosicoli SP16]
MLFSNDIIKSLKIYLFIYIIYNIYVKYQIYIAINFVIIYKLNIKKWREIIG